MVNMTDIYCMWRLIHASEFKFTVVILGSLFEHKQLQTAQNLAESVLKRSQKRLL